MFNRYWAHYTTRHKVQLIEIETSLRDGEEGEVPLVILPQTVPYDLLFAQLTDYLFGVTYRRDGMYLEATKRNPMLI